MIDEINKTIELIKVQPFKDRKIVATTDAIYLNHVSYLLSLVKRQHEVINSVSPLIKEFAEWERENGTLHQGFMGTINADIISEIVSEWAGNEASRRICDQINSLKEIEGD